MNLEKQIFEVGGCVRDEIIGVHTKDIDFTYVVNDKSLSVEQGFSNMKEHLANEGFKTFLETPDCFTIRAMFPKDHEHKGLVADFVMARKEVGYIPGTRRPNLELGSLHDDLSRRDFTVNAIAKSLTGEIIDPFNGRQDIERKVLVTPLDPTVTFLDDPLRVLRGLRFSITKGFELDITCLNTMFQPPVIDKLTDVVSGERIREELTKMFKHDSVRSLRLLSDVDKLNPKFTKAIFKEGIWLMPTMKH